jgi:hypothetical protein
MAKPATYITTSWDDGHPLDFRVAELLTKHGLRGTFYIPKAAMTETMTEAQIRELSCGFEIGAHTLEHVVLTRAADQTARQQIVDSKSWIESNTGIACLMFCAPEGRFASRHLEMVRRACYVGLRSVELCSFGFPRQRLGVMLMPTTLQAYPHGYGAFTKNAVKRKYFANLWRFVVHGRSADWPDLARSLFFRVVEDGGVFHLWGHSWELQETGQWQRLDDVLLFMSEFRKEVTTLTNGQICQLMLTGGAIPIARSPKLT